MNCILYILLAKLVLTDVLIEPILVVFFLLSRFLIPTPPPKKKTKKQGDKNTYSFNLPNFPFLWHLFRRNKLKNEMKNFGKTCFDKHGPKLPSILEYHIRFISVVKVFLHAYVRPRD